MLAAHFAAVERKLLADAAVTSNTGHSLHRGTPKEAFVQQFLRSHLSGRVSISSGEILDCESKPGEPRNQHDVVLHRPELPRLDFGGGIHGLLCESVVATIEVKSTIDYDGVLQATKAARKLKLLKRHLYNPLRFGTVAPAIVTYVVAFAGPASSETVYQWIQKAAAEEGFSYAALPVGFDSRIATPSAALDGVFVLGSGFVHYDNSPISLMIDDYRGKLPCNWLTCDHSERSLLFLFMLLTQAMNNLSTNLFNPTAYTTNVQFGRAGVRA